jgi:hypothetical protein
MSAAVKSGRRHRCRCHHELQLFGGGRHRRFYELDDIAWKHPMMTGACPHCGRRLPGK